MDKLFNFKIQNVKSGDKIINVFNIVGCEMKPTKTGKLFINLKLSNKHCTVYAKLWDATEDILKEIQGGKYIKVAANVNEWMGQIQLVVEKYKLVDESEIDTSLLIQTTELDINEAINDIRSIIDNMTNDNIRRITEYRFNKYEEKLRYYGGAKTHHHNYVAGLLEHTNTMLRNAMFQLSLYKGLNEDLLLGAVIQHDLCKIDELNANTDGIIQDYSTEGELLGHLSMGMEDVTVACISLGIDYKCEEAMLLKHMIISHHGIPEYGSIRYPMIKEAELLYYLDAIDCKMNMFKSLNDKLEEGSFSDRQWALDNRKVYKHKV